MNINKVELDKIEKNVIKICKKGSAGFVEYVKYIDELVKAEKYRLLQELMVSRWNMDYTKYPTVESFKHNSFETIRIFYPSSELVTLKKLYDKYDVYQTGINMFKDGDMIGTLYEDEVIETIDYYQDREFLGKIKKVFVNLKVVDINNMEQFYDDKETTIEAKYEAAIKFMLGI